jgi:DnaJ-class molecular chaperone
VERRMIARRWPQPRRSQLDDGGRVALARNVAYRPDPGPAALSPEPATAEPAPVEPAPTRPAPRPQLRPPPLPHVPREVVVAIMPKRTDQAGDLTLRIDEALYGATLALILVDGSGRCSRCGSCGQVIRPECVECPVRLKLPAPREVTVEVPAGLREDDTLRWSGLGEPGDLILRIRDDREEPLTRHGDNLRYALTVPMTWAALGGKVAISTLDGSETIRLAPGTQPGTTVVVMGKGLPRRDGEGCGDLIVDIDVPTPTDLSPRQRALLAAFVQERPRDLARESSFWSNTSAGTVAATLPMAVAALGTPLTLHRRRGVVEVHLRPGLQHGSTVYLHGLEGERPLPLSLHIGVVVPAATGAKERALLEAFAAERGEMVL